MSVPTTTLLLVRHGQSTWNADGRWQGQADPPLSELGIHQAQTAATRLGTVDAIVTSPQERAAMTAAIISEALGVGPIFTIDDLRERSAGPWSGLTKADIEVEWPGWLDAGKRPDGFEPDDVLGPRVDAALRMCVAEQPGATILVLCHGGVIHNFETAHGLQDGRIPNLSGRIVTTSGLDGPWQLGEQLQLLDEGMATGGERHRI